MTLAIKMCGHTIIVLCATQEDAGTKKFFQFSSVCF